MLRLFLPMLALAAVPLSAQLVPDAPIVHFRLPMFGEDGWKTWELRGESGVYVNENRIDVEQMQLRLYRGGEDLFVETIIQSPLATLFPRDDLARGAGELVIDSATYQISGRDWTWNGVENRVDVRKDARVIYNAELGGLLR